MDQVQNQLDKYWDAIANQKGDLAEQIHSDLVSDGEDDSASGIIALLQQLYVTKLEMDETMPDHPLWAPGTKIGNYTIVDVLGRGGMGIVYRAQQPGLDRMVALKTIRENGRLSPAMIRRFRDEAAAIARLKHPNIVAVYEIGEIDGTLYFSMDLISGGSLAVRLDGRPMDPRKAAQILVDVADAVHYANEQKILHRDIKPSNILIDDSGRPFVLDFGLSRTIETDNVSAIADRLTQSGSIMGTPNYLSPEQATANKDLQSAATDVYGLGATLYEMLCGRPPFVAQALWEILQQIVRSDPVPPRSINPEIPIDLETICLKCLAKEPHQRYATANEFRQDLSRFLDGETILARPASTFTKFRRWCKREPKLAISIASVAALVLALLTTSIFYSVSVRNAMQQAKAAESKATQSGILVRSQRDDAVATLNHLVFKIYSELQQDPGNLKARKQLLQVAVAGFEKILEESPATEPPTHGLIVAHTRLADVLVLLGHESEARVYYQKSISLCRLALLDGPDFQLQSDLAAANLQLGILELSLGDTLAAETNVQNAIANLEQLEIPFDQNPTVFRCYLDCLFAMGHVSEKKLKHQRAVDYYTSLLDAIPEDLVQQDSQLAWLKCVTLARLASGYNQLVEAEKATEHCFRFREYFDRLESLPAEFQYQPNQNPAWALRDVAHVLLRAGRRDEAKELMQKALKAADALLPVHTDNVQVVTDVAKTYVQWAFVERGLNHLAASDTAFEKATEIIESRRICDESLQAQRLLVYPFVFRMQLADRRGDYSRAALFCRRATDVLEWLEDKGQLKDPIYISALTQTRRLLTAYKLRPQAIEDLSFAKQQDTPMAALLLVYRIDHLEKLNSLEQLFDASDALMALEPDDPIQFAIHMTTLARALCRFASRQQEGKIRDDLIDRAFVALSRSVEFDPGFLIQNLNTQPELAILKNEPQFSLLMQFYRENLNIPESR